MDKIFQVSEFNEYINIYLKQTGQVVVEGEISELKAYQDKFLYITIKDQLANLSVFAVAFQISGWRSLSVGMKVNVFGTPGLHEKSGKFSLNANRIVPAGEGALKQAFEKLKLQLESEGLFNPERKRQLSKYPTQIGLITAKDSQAYQDFVKIARERYGGVKIFFHPVQVQGRDSVQSILNAFEYFNSNIDLHLDCLVLTRGGGSLEDLQSFNDEQVVRCVFSSSVPVVVGVGHEGDVSLCDYVADLRASTPSNAAELVFPHRRELTSRVDTSVAFIDSRLYGSLSLIKSNHMKLTNQIISAMSTNIHQQVMSLNTYIHKLDQHLRLRTEKVRSMIVRFHSLPMQIINSIQNKSYQLLQLESRLDNAQKNKSSSLSERFNSLYRLLSSYDHVAVIKRGYSLTRLSGGKIIKSIASVKAGDIITTELSDGHINSQIR